MADEIQDILNKSDGGKNIMKPKLEHSGANMMSSNYKLYATCISQAKCQGLGNEASSCDMVTVEGKVSSYNICANLC